MCLYVYNYNYIKDAYISQVINFSFFYNKLNYKDFIFFSIK